MVVYFIASTKEVSMGLSLFYANFRPHSETEIEIRFEDSNNADEETVSLCDRKNQQPNGKNIFDLE